MSVEPVTLHVTPGGSDQNAGTADQPLATLNGARNRLRQIRTERPLTNGATVLIHNGTYSFDESFELNTEDSGDSPAHPIVYRAAPNEKVRFIGGKKIEGWRPVTDAATLAKLSPKVRGGVVEADLRAAGIQSTTPLASRGFGRGTTPSHSELFFDNLPMTLARWPNADEKTDVNLPGWRRIESFPNTGGDDGHGQMLGKLEAGFFYEGDRPKSWAASDDIWVHGYWAYDWANSYERIAELDKDRRFIKTAVPYGLYGFAKGQKFYFLNVFEELDAPGEYFIDHARGKIYFYPPSTAVGIESLVSTLGTPLIDFRSASNIVIHGPGLSIECVRGYGVQIKDGSHCLLAGITIRNTGSYGVWINGGTHHGVQSCDISNTGDGGVWLHGGDRATLTPSNHFVDNCVLNHQARWSRCYHPCVHMTGVGARATNNVMHDHPHCPVLFNGNDHLIEGNEIYAACWETGDVGAIYMGRDYTERGNIIRLNYLHDLGGIGLGSFAVYLDDCASGTTVVDNIFQRTNMAVLIGGGRDHIVENNIVVDSLIGVHLDGRGISTAKVWHDMVYETMKKRFDDMKADQPPYVTRYPALADLPPYFAKNDGVPGEKNRLSHNVSIGGQWLVVAWGGKPEWVQEDSNFVGAAPGFVDATHPERAMFALADDSPALRMGHRRIAVEKIGLKKDAFRPAWPRVISMLEWQPDPIKLAKTPSGTLRLILLNHGTAAWNGALTVTATPREAVRFLDEPCVRFALEPGESASRFMRVECINGVAELEATSQDARAPGARPARIKLRFPVPVGRIDHVRELGQIAATLKTLTPRSVAAGGANLGEVRFAVAGATLAIHARVIDTAITRHEKNPWEGSCIEVFGAMASDLSKPAVGQIYLMPATAGLPDAGLFEQSGDRIKDEQIQVQSARRADGYDLVALMPLSRLNIAPSANQFLLEVIFNSAATPGAGSKRSSLFGSTAAYSNTSRFGAMVVV